MKLLKMAEVANRLGVSRNTVWRLVKRGQLPGFRIGKQLLVAEEDLEAFLRAHREGVEPGEPADTDQ